MKKEDGEKIFDLVNYESKIINKKLYLILALLLTVIILTASFNYIKISSLESKTLEQYNELRNEMAKISVIDYRYDSSPGKTIINATVQNVGTIYIKSARVSGTVVCNYDPGYGDNFGGTVTNLSVHEITYIECEVSCSEYDDGDTRFYYTDYEI